MNQQLIESYEAEGYVNRALSESEIAKMLSDHGVSWVRSNAEIFAVDETETNVTGWQLFDMLHFLNY